MSKCIIIPNGIITIAKTEFECPQCEYKYGEDFYAKQLEKSKYGVIYKKCKVCKEKLGISPDMKGDIKVWLKKNEDKL